jgi:RNA polymerase sigma factor (TIGR02999 family)
MTKPTPPIPPITQYLARWSAGDRAAFDALLPLVESELRRIARRSLRGERADHTLQPTALVNEAWLKFEAERDMQWRDRGHFFAVAAQIMRFILVDYARRRRTDKRGRGFCRVSLSDALQLPDVRVDGIVDIDDALTRLARSDERKARVATLRLFAGATVEETARALGISPITVMRDWRFARAWLQRELHG